MPYKNFEKLLNAKLTGEDWDKLHSEFKTKNEATYHIRMPHLNDNDQLIMFAELLGIKAIKLHDDYGVGRGNVTDRELTVLKKAAA